MEAMEIQHRPKHAAMEDYCALLGGTRPIHSILIANNGMAAVKFMRGIRGWAYETFGSDKAVVLVAMATPEDMRINAEHIRMADQFVEVPGGTNNNNYANVQLIAEVAERTGVGAVWPGWGHASENPELPESLVARDIVFLGPPAAPMAALGDKIGSSLIAQAAGVPTLPWSGSKVSVAFESCKAGIPEHLYSQACVSTAEEALTMCQEIGYPAMIKASWGGGGKGIRKVHNDEEVKALFKQVQGEVPGSPIFIMKVASQCRHLEVQLLCDQYGNVAALHSRDCSVQRRHQKIIEEGPITIAPPETVRLLEQGARRLAQCVNYIGAATVEYLYSMDTGEFYFLELNPRLQVEHPVTEWIAGVNLPAAQLSVGMGIPLWKLPEIRRFYGKEETGELKWRVTAKTATPFDFDVAVACKPKGHVVAVRVTSEDPDDGFKPTTGRVQELSFRSKQNSWAYFSVKSGGGIHEFSDSQFGHVFAFGESRQAAIANMVLGLKELHIRGEIHTNTDYTVDLLHAPEYRDNKIHTGWLDGRIAMRVRTERPLWYLSVVCGAIYRTSRLTAARVSEYTGYLEKGQIPPKNISLVNFRTSLNIEGSKYTMDLSKGGPGTYRVKLNSSCVEAEVHTLRDGGLLVQMDGNSHVVYGEEEAAGTRLLIDGRTCLLQNDHDPSRLVAETPCKLLRFLVADGSHVDTDTPYAEVEVMKMCMPLLSPASGTIRMKHSEGQAMVAGDLIAVLDLDDPSAVRKALPFQDGFPSLGKPLPVPGKVHQRCASSINAAYMILAGYEHNVDEVVQTLLKCLDDPQLPVLQWQESIAVLATRLPSDLKLELDLKLKGYEASLANLRGALDFPAKAVREVLEKFLASLAGQERPSQERLVEPLLTLAKSYEGGREGHACSIVKSLFDEYLLVEEPFSQGHQADVIENLRHLHKKDLRKVVDIVFSHQGIKTKNALILRLMEALVYPNPSAYREQLVRFAALSDGNFSELAVKSSLLLEQSKLSGIRADIARSLSELGMFTEDEEGSKRSGKNAIEERMEYWVDAPVAVEDALVALFDHGEHGDHTLQRRVIETYIRRLYQPYLVKGSTRMQWQRSAMLAFWQFQEEEPLKSSETRSLSKWRGAMVVLSSLNSLSSAVRTALEESFGVSLETKSSAEPNLRHGNVLHVALVGRKNQLSAHQDSGDEDQAQERVEKLAKALKGENLRALLLAAGVGVVSCIIQRDEGRGPIRHCFHWSEEAKTFAEDPLFRYIEPPLSSFLELDNLKDLGTIRYSLSRDRQWHLYSIQETTGRSRIKRMFLRTLVRQTKTFDKNATFDSLTKALQGALEELELTEQKAEHVHMYLCLLKPQDLDSLLADESFSKEDVVSALEALVQKIHGVLGTRMHRLAVLAWEFRISFGSEGVWRVVVSNATGYTCTVQVYKEVNDPLKQRAVYYSPFCGMEGPLHGVPLPKQCKPLDDVDKKRLNARRNRTTYCYDFPLVFEGALRQCWTGLQKPAGSICHVKELVFSADQTWDSTVVETSRPIAVNNIGMVAWLMELCTPEYPEGREVIVISNDITHEAGSFGPKEDAFFKSVTELACEKKLPLIYLAANSGARIDLANEIRSCFQVGWLDDSCPESGFQYLYLTPQDYEKVGTFVNAHRLELPGGVVRWVIDDIIGQKDGLGVENLSGSGAIASAYSKAYRETFTLTYVSGKTVGIGAYLARLGMRCIQRLDQPVILTGFSALNKLLGREVYSSQMQLGGPKVMATNGVTHITVSDDLEGVSSILRWLSYVPSVKGGALPIRRVSSGSDDPQDRPVTYCPENSCDARAAIAGVEDGEGKWMSGIFDQGSFCETLEGWARTVVTGRARLGGIPLGVIAVETQTVMQVIPADPGQLDSQERVVPQAGQVWFPDSAAKTAQAMLDFNNEGLPLFILANWRGFSGGQRDLFEGVLQAGSTIVEHLRTYKYPVFVYVPRTGELRGGAWVVVDSKINPEQVEMYADNTARAGVLEAEGVSEIKFRKEHRVSCMKRLHPELMEVSEEQARSQIEKLGPVYQQIALRFIDMHDTAFRLAAKGIIKRVVPWEESRSFFYHRLVRRLEEEKLIREVAEATGFGHRDALNLIKHWFLSDTTDDWSSDAAFLDWLRSNKAKIDEDLRKRKVEASSKQLPLTVQDLLVKMDPLSRQGLKEQLRSLLN